MMFDWLRTLIMGEPRHYKIGDRVCFKNETYSVKNPQKTVYVVDDIWLSSGFHKHYKLLIEDTCFGPGGAGGSISGSDLETAPHCSAPTAKKEESD